MTEAHALTGMLGRIAPAMLERHGEYCCIVGDKRVRFVLAKAPEYVRCLPCGRLSLPEQTVVVHGVSIDYRVCGACA
jgi:hypothetical protein